MKTASKKNVSPGTDFREIEKVLLSKHVAIKKNGLDFLSPILARLGDPQNALGRVIHITGTNGKGSTACLAESVLRNSGYRTALYTSPHIHSLRERIKFCGREIPEKEFARIFREVYPLCSGLSFFEIMTVMAFRWFSLKKPDFSVIEVGIGGKYDTTNVIKRKELCFITSLDYDHKDLLGNTLEEIAEQKAGIISEGSLCVCPEYPARLKKIISASASAAGGRAVFVKDFFKTEKIDLAGNRMLVKNLRTGEKCRLGIIGSRQTLNLSMLKTGLSALQGDGPLLGGVAFRKGVEKARIEARFQVVRASIRGKKKLFMIDGAHNGEAMRSVLKMLDQAGVTKPSFVFSMLNTKDYRKSLEILSGKAGKIVFTSVASEKAIDPHILADEYQKIAPLAEVEVSQEVGEAMVSAASFSDNICVCGSFYLAAAALNVLRKSRKTAGSKQHTADRERWENKKPQRRKGR